LKRLLDLFCGLLAAVALFAIMALTLFDVMGRKLLSQSIPGSLELTEILMVVVIFAALPLVSMHGEHVAFDSLDALMPAWLRRAQQIAVDLLCALALGLLAWLMWGKAMDMTGYGETTAQLKLPVGIFVGLMSVMCALAAAVHAVLAWRPGDGGEAPIAEGGGAT
jgi:TRAP-type C4-dicarboxylate transport system permease small subunit